MTLHGMNPATTLAQFPILLQRQRIQPNHFDVRVGHFDVRVGHFDVRVGLSIKSGCALTFCSRAGGAMVIMVGLFVHETGQTAVSTMLEDDATTTLMAAVVEAHADVVG
eukprot:gene2802-717_t